MSKGFLLVIDGVDGSGKTTQVSLLSQYLKSKNIAHEVISFPRYEDNLYGKLIKEYLEGEFGDIDQVNPSLIALAFAGDRALAKHLIENWLNEGKIVIANRYVSSSKAHLGANLPDEEREKFMEWVDQLEYQTNNMPKPDLTILLKVDPKIGQTNAKVANGPDIHEENLSHLEKASKIFLKLALKNDWEVIDCMEGNKMKSKEKIHQEVTLRLNNFANNL